MDDDDKLPPLGDNTEKFLDEVKKGKSRNFLLVCKGPKVTYLAVKKKPVKKSDLADAKKAGYKGDPYFGVVSGKGMDLVFHLARADGYKDAPVKDKVLKDFLEERAEFKCKPTFEMVDEPPAVGFDDEDLQNPLIARFMKMDEAISAALDAKPDLEASIMAQVKEIRTLLQAGEFNPAEQKIDALAKLLTDATGSSAGETKPTESAAELALTFTSRLKVLKPDIDRVLTSGVAVVDELKTTVADAATAARDKAWAVGLELLEQAESLLRRGQKQLAEKSAPSEEATAFNERLKALFPRIKDATAKAGEFAQAIQARMADASAAGKRKEFVAARLLLDDLEQLLKRAEATGKRVSPQFDKAWQQAKIAWNDAIDEVNAQLERLRVALLKEDDEELKKIAEFGLNAITAGHRVPLQAAIVNLDAAAADAKGKFVVDAQEMVDEFRDHIDTDDQVEACDDNPFEVSVAIRATLDPALAQMRQALDQAFA